MDSVNQRQKRWIYSVAIGVISIIIGILLVIFKGESLNVILIISGVLLIIDGAITVLGGLMEKNLLSIIVGGLFIALGVAMIIFTSLFSDIFMVLLATLLIFMGILGAMSAFDKSADSFVGMIFSLVFAILLIAAGVIALLNLDKAEDWAMIVMGVMMIVSGILDVIGGLLSYRLMKTTGKIKERRASD